MAQYYINFNFLNISNNPAYYWIKETTIAFETSRTLAGGEWAKKQALAYRQPLVTPTGNILALDDVRAELLAVAAVSVSAAPAAAAPAAAAAVSVSAAAAVSAPAPAVVSRLLLPTAEVDALVSIYSENGGAQWQYKKDTDAVGGGKNF